MFKEISELAHFGVEVITNSRPSNPYKWRPIFFLYCELEQVQRATECLVTHYFPKPLDAKHLLNTKSFGSPLEKWVHVTNEDFQKVTKTTNDFVAELRNVFVNIWMDIPDEFLKLRTECHLSWKWYWFVFFQSHYASGVITPDGSTLKRTRVLTINGSYEQVRRLSAFTDSFEKSDIAVSFSDFQRWLKDKAIYAEELNIETLEERLKLVDIGNQNLEHIRKEQERLAEFISENCSIDYLLRKPGHGHAD